MIQFLQISILQFIIIYFSLTIMKSRKITIRGAAVSLLLGVSFTVFMNPISFLANQFIFLYVLILGLFYEKDFLLSLCFASLTTMIVILFDHFANLLGTISQVSGILSYFIVYTFFILLFSYIIRKGFVEKFLRKASSADVLFAAIFINILYFTFFISVTVLETVGNLNAWIGMNLLFLCLYVLLFSISFFFAIRSIRVEEKQKHQILENQLLQNYLIEQNKHHDEIRKFRHDYRNILFSLEEYIKQKDTKGLEDYYSVICKADSDLLQKVEIEGLDCIHIPELKGILLHKLIEISENNISYSFYCKEMISSLPCKNITLIRALGIVLDNALEEVKELEFGRISIDISKDKEDTIFMIVNTCREDIEPLHILLDKDYSSKKENTGIGLMNLYELMSKDENFIVESKIENKNFIQSLYVIEKP